MVKLACKLPLGNSNPSNEFIAVDITKTSAKAVVFGINEDDPNKLIAKGVSTRDSYQSELTKESLKAIVDECLSQADSSTSDAILGLSGPSVMGFILIVKSNRDKPDKEITEKEMDKMYEKVRNSAQKQMENRWNTFYADSAQFEPLDLVVTAIHLDEELVDDPENRTGETLQLTVFCSYAEKKYYENAVNQLSKMGLSLMTVTTTMYSQVKLLSQNHKNFVLIDIGKDYTELCVVFGNNIIQSRSFDLGGDFFTAHLSSKMGLDHNAAKGKKEAYSSNSLPDDEADRVSDALYEAGLSWRNGIVAALNSMSGIKSFPDKILLSGGGSSLNIIEELLLEDSWRQPVPFANDPEVDNVSKKYWNDHIEDEINVLNNARMFIPVSLGVIKIELEENE